MVMAQNYWLELLRVRRAVNRLEPGCSGAVIVPVRSRRPVEPAVSQHSGVVMQAESKRSAAKAAVMRAGS